MSVKSISEVFEQMVLGAYRNSDPDTSRAAAQDAAGRAATLRSRCYDLLRSAGEGRTVKRPSPSGSLAIVWRVTS